LQVLTATDHSHNTIQGYAALPTDSLDRDYASTNRLASDPGKRTNTGANWAKPFRTVGEAAHRGGFSSGFSHRKLKWPKLETSTMGSTERQSEEHNDEWFDRIVMRVAHLWFRSI
jgi:hypothetical protein